MEVRIKSLDNKLSSNPVCGIGSAAEVLELLKVYRTSYAYGPSMHSFFTEQAPHRRISMKDLIQNLSRFKRVLNAHEEQHILDLDDDDPMYDPIESCEFCQKVAELRTRNPNLLVQAEQDSHAGAAGTIESCCARPFGRVRR